MRVSTIRVSMKSRRQRKSRYPAAKRTPNGNAGAKIPQDPDDDDAGAQPVGSGLGTQARVGEGRGGRGGAWRVVRKNRSSSQRREAQDVRLAQGIVRKTKQKRKDNREKAD